MHNFCSLLCRCCMWGSLDIVVNHCRSWWDLHNPGFLFFIWFFLNFDVKFDPTDWKLVGYRIGNIKMAMLSMVKHCAIPELPSPDTTALFHLHGFTYQWGWRHEMYETLKTSWLWSSGQSKKAWKDVIVTGKLWKEIAFLWRCQYSSLAHYHYNS